MLKTKLIQSPKRQKSLPILLVFFLSAGIIFSSCSADGESSSDNLGAEKVRVHQLGDVQHLNFTTATDNQSTLISYLTHQYLYNLDPKTYEFVPVLVKERAKITEQPDGKILLDFEIRPEAKWDNGTPITGNDIVFSLKGIFAPEIEAVARLKPYLDYIEDIIVDEENPKKFTVVCKEAYMSAETSIASNLMIIPSYVYDPTGALEKYPLKDFLNEETNKARIANDESLKEYAKFFNSDDFKFKTLSGSGPYAFSKLDTNERLVLKKKKDWWGDAVHEKDPNHPWFQAYPEEVVYTTITDLTTAVVALRGQSLDAMQAVPNKQFIESLQTDEAFKSKYSLFTPPLFSYDYIGLNKRDPRLEDLRVRKALAHAMNVDQVVKTELYGLGEQMTNIIHPLFKGRFNEKLKPYEFDIQKSKDLLAEAGWTDSNKNGILDKEINGELEELKFTIMTNNGNDRRKTSALVFKDGLSKIGVEIEVRILEWATFIDKVHKKDFEMYVLGWATSPVESDPAQIWHSDSYNDGSNYVGFGTPESDALIDKLRKTVDDKERFEYYKQLQQMIHDDVPYIFLVVQKNRVVISKKYGNAYGSGVRQGFHTNGLSPVNSETQN